MRLLLLISLLFLTSTTVLSASDKDEAKKVEVVAETREGVITGLEKRTQVKLKRGTKTAKRGRTFLVVNFLLNEEKSLSVLDYRLEIDGELYPCVGLSVEEEKFDVYQSVIALKDPESLIVLPDEKMPKTRVIKKEDKVRLLYVIPENISGEKARLVFTMANTRLKKELGDKLNPEILIP